MSLVCECVCARARPRVPPCVRTHSLEVIRVHGLECDRLTIQ